DKPGKTTVVLEGAFQGKKVVQEFPVEVGDGGELAPRAWAEVTVASLLALNDPELDPLVTACCQEYGIASRVASFLVLEDEGDYKRLKLEEEREKAFKGDLGKYVSDAWGRLARDVSPREGFLRLLRRIDARTKVLTGAHGEHVKKLLELLRDEEF